MHELYHTKTLNVEKQNPRKGTETYLSARSIKLAATLVEKQNPRKGTETPARIGKYVLAAVNVEKQNPRKGTETAGAPRA